MPPDLARFIRPGDGVLVGQACAEPQTLLEALAGQRGTVSGARVFLGLSYSGIVRPEHADHLRLSSYCGIGTNRALADAKALEILRIPYSQLAARIRAGEIAADVVLVQVSPPNARGEHSLGFAADYLVPALERARTVIAEVNQQIPWTNTERTLRKEDCSLLIESDRLPAALPPARIGETEKAIALHAAVLVPADATLEFGIGALPDAVCSALSARTDLRVHSGSIGDGVTLLKAKAIACALLIGTSKLFEFARENPVLRLRSSEYTHGARALGGIERFVAINSAIEVDYAGQVNSEVAQGRYLGAVGGAPDFVYAANRSAGGLSMILVPAARIVERLSGPVTLPADEAAVVVTQHGAADLRGQPSREREKRLRAISGR